MSTRPNLRSQIVISSVQASDYSARNLNRSQFATSSQRGLPRVRLGGNFYVLHGAARLGDRQPVGAHALEVELDGLLNLAFDFLDRRACGHAARQVRDVGAVVSFAFLDNHRVAFGHSYLLSPDCLRILFNKPGGKSSLGLPGTVTRPGLLACLNCRWLPRVVTRYHPSRRRISRISETFTLPPSAENERSLSKLTRIGRRIFALRTSRRTTAVLARTRTRGPNSSQFVMSSNV